MYIYIYKYIYVYYKYFLKQTTHPKQPTFLLLPLSIGPVCAMGFSAGGHLVASVAGRRRNRRRNSQRNLEAQALIYPCSLVGSPPEVHETNGPGGCFGCFFWGGEKLPFVIGFIIFHDFLLFSKLNIVYSIHSPAILTCFLLENGGPGLKMYGSY